MPYKHLVKTLEGKYLKYFAGYWMDTGIVDPTADDFLSIGMDDVNISQDMLKQLKTLTESICFESYIYNHWISRNSLKICSNFFSLTGDDDGVIHYLNNDGLHLFYDSFLDVWSQEKQYFYYNAPSNGILFDNKLINFTATEIHEYDFFSKNWQIKSEILNKNIFKHTCTIGENIYVVARDGLYLYDTKFKLWSSISNVLFNSEKVCMIPYQDKIYVLSKGQHLVFDTLLRTWSYFKPYKNTECYGGIAHNSSLFFILGNEVVKFDPLKKQYTPVSEISNVGEGLTTVAVQDRLHTLVSGLSDTQEIYIP